jgi:hypothetical protein
MPPRAAVTMLFSLSESQSAVVEIETLSCPRTRQPASVDASPSLVAARRHCGGWGAVHGATSVLSRLPHRSPRRPSRSYRSYRRNRNCRKNRRYPMCLCRLQVGAGECSSSVAEHCCRAMSASRGYDGSLRGWSAQQQQQGGPLREANGVPALGRAGTRR